MQRTQEEKYRRKHQSLSSSATSANPLNTRANRKRSLPATFGKNKKLASSALEVISGTVMVDERKNVDVFWSEIIAALKKYTEAELKMFDSEEVNTNVVEVDQNSCSAYSKFLCQLIEKFTKLRRFPKLIAKFLCCLRDHFMSPANSEGTNVSTKSKMTPATCLLLPVEFLNTTGPIIASLPAGQTIDLWKVLQHNLKEECLNVGSDILNTSGYRTFTLVVSELFSNFLVNVKVIDYAVQTSTLEKVSELMLSLSTDCLPKYAKLIFLSEDNGDPELLKEFLKLAYTWGELYGLQLHYNSRRYKAEPLKLPSDSSPMNLCYLHNYLTCESWLHLQRKVNSLNNISCEVLMTKLVAQKLKFLLTFEMKTGAENDPLQEHLVATAQFIFSKQQIFGSPSEIYNLTSNFLDASEIIDQANSMVESFKHGGLPAQVADFPQDFQLHYALLLEIIVETISRLAKIKHFKKTLTEVTEVVFSLENRSYLFKQDVSSKEVFKLLLNSVNELLENGISDQRCETDFSCDLVIDHVQRLSQLNLEDYPLEVRVLLSMCSIIMLIPLMQVASPASLPVLNMTSSILYQSSQNSSGNKYLFAVRWTNFFIWFQKHISSDRAIFSSRAQSQIVRTVLQNIYQSPKSVAEFEKEFDKICEMFQFSRLSSNVGLTTLEFLIQELKIAIKSKSKLVPKIQTHIDMLIQPLIKYLKTDTKVKLESTSRKIPLRACWLLRLVMENQVSPTDETHPVGLNEISKLKILIGAQVNSALEILSQPDSRKKCGVYETDEDYEDSRMYGLALLHSLCKSREEYINILPGEFILELWSINMQLTSDDWKHLENLVPSEKIHLLPTVICENATAEEFEKILFSIMAEIVSQFGTSKLNAEKVVAATKIIEIIIDAKLTSEKKTLRTKFVEDFLYASLQFSLQFDQSSECLGKIVLPFLRLQTKLLSRTHPICSQPALAICLTSITSTPLNGIENTELYRKVFCAVADLLNAFTIHRQDVVSFRTHIYMQFLIESVVTRADQKKKLSNEEIVDLRYCAHAMERICQSTKSGRKEFAKIAPYFVAIMMRQFESFAVYPAVKDPLQNGSYKLLNLCDKHGVSQINSMLTVGSREIFSRVYELYNKFYRYKGKV